MGNDWIIPALAAVGLPVLIGWLQGVVKRGDEAQQRTLDKLETDVRRLEECLATKADSQHISELLAEVRSMNAKLENLQTLVLTELGKRPTREEMVSYVQTARGPK